MKELKKCPFCGCEATVEKELLCSHWVYEVRCSMCYARGTKINNRTKAIEAWNRRVYEE